MPIETASYRRTQTCSDFPEDGAEKQAQTNKEACRHCCSERQKPGLDELNRQVLRMVASAARPQAVSATRLEPKMAVVVVVVVWWCGEEEGGGGRGGEGMRSQKSNFASSAETSVSQDAVCEGRLPWRGRWRRNTRTKTTLLSGVQEKETFTRMRVRA